MPLDTAFRLSFYTALGLAAACLVQADSFFLPWLVAGLPLLLAVFVLAWRKEGKWAISETAANYLGLAIALGAVGWILLQLPRSEEEFVSGGVAWPAGLLPHLGPLILLLLVVKLFRPKRLPDFWVIQTIGLMMVTLGCVLAGEAAFGFLLVGYLGSLLWCLSLFHVYRERRLAGEDLGATMPLFLVSDAPRPAGVPWRYLGVLRVTGWLSVVLATAGLLFVVTPRSGTSRWVPQQLATSSAKSMRTGIESGIDLNRVGQLELSHEPAFRVAVTDGAGRPASLPPDQRFRAEVFDYYLKGHWLTWAQAQELFRLVGPRLQAVDPEPPPEGEGRLHLRFSLRPAEAGGLILGEPVDVRWIGLDPLVGDNRPRVELFHELPGCNATLSFMPAKKANYRYSQVITPPYPPDREPARHLGEEYREYLTTQPVPDPVRDWVAGLLPTLPGLRADEIALDGRGFVADKHHARVARALCDYLSRSRDFGYSLTLRREDRSLDPTADFLLNVKQGHCERFAGGLALMLRAVGVPCRVVKGYRGVEPEGPGRYVVRQSSAHSWVQVLAGDGDARHWQVLDPTPGGADDGQLGSLVQWVSNFDGEKLWRKFVMDYNTDVQARSLDALWSSLTEGTGLLVAVGALAGAALGLALLWGAWRSRTRLPRGWARRAAPPESPSVVAARGLYERLLALAERALALRPGPGQTPLEFARDVEVALAARATLTDVPARVAGALYRVRFGGRAMPDEQRAELECELARLHAASTLCPEPPSRPSVPREPIDR